MISGLRVSGARSKSEAPMVCRGRRSIVLLSGVSMVCVVVLCLVLQRASSAQLINFSKQDLIDYTAQNPFDRLPDGRPKVPDALIERARDLSSEEVWAVLQGKEYNNQYADGFQVLHPGKTMVGRAFTVQFMPVRKDVDTVAQAKAKQSLGKRLFNQTAIDMLQPG